METRIAFSRHK